MGHKFTKSGGFHLSLSLIAWRDMKWLTFSERMVAFSPHAFLKVFVCKLIMADFMYL